MELHAVTSANLAAIGYDPDSKTLAVRFRSGALWHYVGVPAKVYAELHAAKSHGRYFGLHIRPYYRGVRQEEAR